MGICPVCYEMIDFLWATVKELKYFTYNLKDGYIQDPNPNKDDYEEQFFCPECNRLVAEDEPTAEAILEAEKREDVEDIIVP